MNATQTRPLRIYIAMQESPLPKAIKQVLPMLEGESPIVYVENHDEADLVIFTDVRDVERGYSKEKSYAYLKTYAALDLTLPDNCKIIGVVDFLPGILTAIDDARKTLNPIPEEPASEQTINRNMGGLKVLIIDDTPKHIASAKSGVPENYHLTTATGYEEAMEILGREKFGIVLTDLHLPMSSKTMGSKFRLGELVPYGVLLMIEAARQGAKFVGVVTDLSHHDDPFSAAFDHYSRVPIQIEGAKVMMMHARLDRDGAKDWAEALTRLMS